MHDPYIAELLNRFFKGTTSPDEKIVLARWINESDEEEIRLLMKKSWEGFDSEEVLLTDRAEELLRSISREAGISEEGLSKIIPIGVSKWIRVAVASSVIFLLCSAAYFIFFDHKDKEAIAESRTIQPSGPGLDAPNTVNAVITLANGEKITLDNANNGVLANLRNSEIVKMADGRIVYRQDGNNRGEMQYNTLDVPRGSQIVRLQLSDGSTVVLNAASSITYPASFSGNVRKVEITGEAYFEVTKDASRKFVVVANDVTTEVLGTHFNVNAYQDEAQMKITLLEGSVAVSLKEESVAIKPGQQVRVNSGLGERKKLKVVSDANIDAQMAWKEGLFVFNKTDIRTIMREISRWYDVNVRFEENISGFLSGSISRKENAIEVLKLLELTDEVHFKVNGREVLVTH